MDKQEFASIPEWALPSSPDVAALFEVAALVDLENKWMRLDAATQRAILPATGGRNRRLLTMQATCTIADNGSLRVSCDAESREELSDALKDGRHPGLIWADLLEHYTCNGSFAPFDASTGNPSVGLTSAPCIAERLDMDDNARFYIMGRFWYFSEYQTRSELEELAQGREVIFTLGG